MHNISKQVPTCDGIYFCQSAEVPIPHLTCLCVMIGTGLSRIMQRHWRLPSSLTGLNQAIPNYTCRKDPKPIAVVTGIVLEISTQIGDILEL